MAKRKRRVYGKSINFKSLSCEPINEHGVVYLFGVLHNVFDFKIESIQAGFPDCTARRKIGGDRWEDVSIEFEFKSKSFLAHKHDPDKVDIIVCWEHNWPKCPKHIEVIELKSLISKMETISEDIKEPSKLTAYQALSREMRLKGKSFEEISRMWKREKTRRTKDKVAGYSEWQLFCRENRMKGKSFKQIAGLWRKKRKK